ncbi:MAG: hypothetical protein LBK95_15535 [Bifidobacteriaceae bacterium]|nr:hypothetical protein [Bifidobacteriaceae bacterium]
MATAAVVAQGTETSSDNRSRIAAAGLAQRELGLAENTIAMSIDGAESLLQPDTQVNPNVTADLASGDPVFAYKVDGERFRVERRAARQAIGAGSPCEAPAGSAVKQFATLVEVTVTWQGMSPGTSAHVASALFAPHRDAASSAQGGRAVLGVKVTGAKGPTQARADMKVRVTGPGVAAEAVPDAKGCAVFEVEPAAAGFDYEVTLLGPTGSVVYLNPNRDLQPSQIEYSVKPGGTRPVSFEGYDAAASLTVTVDTTLDPSVTSVSISPKSGGMGGEVTAALVDGEAEFELLYPGEYDVSAGAFTPAPVTLEAGEHSEVSIPWTP